ncbi:MAG: bifunctional diaminohydroxyphosphoribosylaminopyrimidine deaminase/5-amino-6-(5-phosphoribosylamino)uracil reductase RibD, partial [Opitutales bacterium]
MDDTADKAAMEARMRRAIDLARRAWGDTHPNPHVGAVIVAPDGSVVGEGWHARAGAPHAEVAALLEAGQRARGATLYVTLEPCCTQGRTPPCTQAIRDAGIARVVAGATDPNPAHAGRGYCVLREAGIKVVHGILEDECEDLNLIFNQWISKGQSLFAAKVATTLCGHIATRTRDSKWITGDEARADAHRWRRYFPAIAVGSGTVLADDPRLSVRQPGAAESCPLRFVFDRTLRTARGMLPGLYRDAYRARTTVVTDENAPTDGEDILCELGVSVLRLPEGAPFWPAFRTHCVRDGITGVLFEGGSE